MYDLAIVHIKPKHYRRVGEHELQYIFLIASPKRSVVFFIAFIRLITETTVYNPTGFRARFSDRKLS